MKMNATDNGHYVCEWNEHEKHEDKCAAAINLALYRKSQTDNLQTFATFTHTHTHLHEIRRAHGITESNIRISSDFSMHAPKEPERAEERRVIYLVDLFQYK